MYGSNPYTEMKDIIWVDHHSEKFIVKPIRQKQEISCYICLCIRCPICNWLGHNRKLTLRQP